MRAGLVAILLCAAPAGAHPLDDASVGLGFAFGYHGDLFSEGLHAPIELGDGAALVPGVRYMVDYTYSVSVLEYSLGVRFGTRVIGETHRVYGVLHLGFLHGLDGPGDIAGNTAPTIGGYGGLELLLQPEDVGFFEFGGAYSARQLDDTVVGGNSMLLQAGYRHYF